MGERTTEVVKAIKDHIENTCKNVLQHPFFSQQQPDRSTWLTRNGFKCPETKEGTTLGQNYQKIQVIAQNWVKFIQIECSKQVKHKGNKKKDDTTEESSPAICVPLLSETKGVEVITIEEKEVFAMCKENGFINEKIVDAYLLHLVMPDIDRFLSRWTKQYIPTSFFNLVTDTNFYDGVYKEDIHRRFADMHLKKWDVTMFGASDHNGHYFLIVFFYNDNHICVFEPYTLITTQFIIPKFCNLLFQHCKWLESGEKEFKETKYEFTADEQQKWEIKYLLGKHPFMGHHRNAANCGFSFIVIAESFARECRPKYDEETIEAIRNNHHLISALATGVPLFGDKTLYTPELFQHTKCFSSTGVQEQMYDELPEEMHYVENDVIMEKAPYASYIMSPYPYESLYFHWRDVPGKKLYMGYDGNCLFYCYAFFIQQRYKDKGKDAQVDDTSVNGILPKLPMVLKECLRDVMKSDFFNLSKNGVYAKWRKENENLAEEEKQEDPLDRLAHFGMYCDKNEAGVNDVLNANYIEIGTNMFRHAMKFRPAHTEVAANQDPFTVPDKFQKRMPKYQIPYHFAFCHYFDTSLVIYTERFEKECGWDVERDDGKWTTEIYCAHPTDPKLCVKEGLHPQDFETFPNQILMFFPLNERDGDGTDHFMHYDVLVPNDFDFANASFARNAKSAESEHATEKESRASSTSAAGNAKSTESKDATKTMNDTEESDLKLKSSAKSTESENVSGKVTKRTNDTEESPSKLKSSASSTKESKKRKKAVKKVCQLPKLSHDLLKSFREVYATEMELKERKNTPSEFNRAAHVDQFFATMNIENTVQQRFSKQRSTFDAKLKKAGILSSKYRDFADQQQKKDRVPQITMNSIVTQLQQEGISEGEQNKLLDDTFGSKPPKLSRVEKNEYQEWMDTMTEQQKQDWKRDQEEGKSMLALRYVFDDPEYRPYYEGKWKGKKQNERNVVKGPLNKQWLLSHFHNRYLELVRRHGQEKVKVGNEWKLRPLADRWLNVPMGTSDSNVASVADRFLCKSIPIRHPQGEISSCLFNAVASAFSYMKYDEIAEHLLTNKLVSVDVDSEMQWQKLKVLLEERCIDHNDMHFKFYNNPQRKRRSIKNRLDVETLTTDHRDAMCLHAVCLIGQDGSQDHAVAIVNGMIFDSCATHAMLLGREPLNWCCNCKGGYGKTGRALRIKIKDCSFKKMMLG